MVTWLAVADWAVSTPTPQQPGHLAWPALAGGVAALLTVLTIVLGGVRWGWSSAKRWLEPILSMARDWHGERPRPGFDGRPSFPERMTSVEASQREMCERLRRVESRLGGSPAVGD